MDRLARIARWALLVNVVGLAGCFSGGNGRPLDLETDDDLGLAGQSGWSGGSYAGDGDGDGDGDERQDDAPLPEPFSHELESLIVQPVRWASVDVAVIAARQVRGLDLEHLYPEEIYVELEVELTNRSTEEFVYENRNTWDLILGSDERLQPVDGITMSILPGDVASALLHYEVPAEVSLAGSALELNGQERTALEAERIPLDAPYEAMYPRRLASMAGQSVMWVSGADEARVSIDQAIYDVNVARDGRAEQGQRIVWLDLAFTAVEYGYFYSGDVRLVVDGRAAEPAEAMSGIIDEGITDVFELYFSIDEDVTSFELVFPDGTPEGKRFAVDVNDTVLATDLP